MKLHTAEFAGQWGRKIQKSSWSDTEATGSVVKLKLQGKTAAWDEVILPGFTSGDVVSIVLLYRQRHTSHTN